MRSHDRVEAPQIVGAAYSLRRIRAGLSINLEDLFAIDPNLSPGGNGGVSVLNCALELNQRADNIEAHVAQD